MKNKISCKKGFTLIELLVVVLIIGILASIALPQYEKAVEKSRASEAITILKNLRDQQSLCFLEKGEVSACMQGDEDDNLFTNASITISGGEDDECNDPRCGPSTKDFTYALDGEYIYATRKPYGTKYYFETTALTGAVTAVNRIICHNQSETENWCNKAGFTKQEGNVYVKP